MCKSLVYMHIHTSINCLHHTISTLFYCFVESAPARRDFPKRQVEGIYINQQYFSTELCSATHTMFAGGGSGSGTGNLGMCGMSNGIPYNAHSFEHWLHAIYQPLSSHFFLTHT